MKRSPLPEAIFFGLILHGCLTTTISGRQFVDEEALTRGLAHGMALHACILDGRDIDMCARIIQRGFE